MNHPDEFGPTAESAYCIGGVLHTMLLHTVPSTGVVEIFVGVDRAWDAAFWQLRAGRGLLVSAKRQNGTVSFVGLWSRHAQEVVIRVPGEPAWSPAAAAAPLVQPATTPVTAAQAEGGWRVQLQANGSAVLHLQSALRGGPFVVGPLASNRSEENWLGYRRPFPAQH